MCKHVVRKVLPFLIDVVVVAVVDDVDVFVVGSLRVRAEFRYIRLSLRGKRLDNDNDDCEYVVFLHHVFSSNRTHSIYKASAPHVND